MKIIVILSLVAAAFGQIDIEHPTLGAALRQSQTELTQGHEFAEEWILQNRQLLSETLERIEVRVIDDFMNAYAEIQTIADNTRTTMVEEYPEPSFCKDRVRERWDLQVHRFGSKMSQCLAIADG